MLRNELKTFKLLKAIYQNFPEAEIQRPDGSRKKLSKIFRAPEKKSTTEISFQRTNSCQQLSFNFGDYHNYWIRGGI